MFIFIFEFVFQISESNTLSNFRFSFTPNFPISILNSNSISFSNFCFSFVFTSNKTNSLRPISLLHFVFRFVFLHYGRKVFTSSVSFTGFRNIYKPMLLTNSDYVFPDQSGFAEKFIIETFFYFFLATFSFIRRTMLFNINIWYESSDSQSIFGLLLIFLVQLHVQISESEKYSYLRLLILFDNQICFLVQKFYGNHFKKSPWKIRSLCNCLSIVILRFLSNNVFSLSIQVSGSKTIPYFRLRFGKFFKFKCFSCFFHSIC